MPGLDEGMSHGYSSHHIQSRKERWKAGGTEKVVLFFFFFFFVNWENSHLLDAEVSYWPETMSCPKPTFQRILGKRDFSLPNSVGAPVRERTGVC